MVLQSTPIILSTLELLPLAISERTFLLELIAIFTLASSTTMWSLAITLSFNKELDSKEAAKSFQTQSSKPEPSSPRGKFGEVILSYTLGSSLTKNYLLTTLKVTPTVPPSFPRRPPFGHTNSTTRQRRGSRSKTTQTKSTSRSSTEGNLQSLSFFYLKLNT